MLFKGVKELRLAISTCLPILVKFSVAELNAVSFSTFEFREDEFRERHTLFMNVKVSSHAFYTPFFDYDSILKKIFPYSTVQHFCLL